MTLDNPYRPGYCWFGVHRTTSFPTRRRSAGTAPIEPCGVGGVVLYEISKGSMTLATCTAYLCDKHVDQMRSNGYMVTPVTTKTA